MTLQSIQWSLALLARQTARLAKRHPELNDAADILFTACVQLKVSKHLLPI